MTHLRTFGDIEEALAKYVPLAAHITGRNITLDRMKPLMKLFGNPETKLRIIHIAGTSGKTSTAYFAANLLKQAGLKAGLTVSPHIDSVAERIQINLEPITEQEFTNALGKFLNILEKSDIEPTYFELLVAFAYWYFVKTEVDYAVIETGMGGLQDGTNVATRPDKLCVITDIGLDHMHILGNTAPEIAAQKAGIIHPENHVIMYEQAPEIADVIKLQCKKQNSTLDLVHENELKAAFKEKAQLESLPEFQQRNWLLAYESYKWLASRDKLTNLSAEQLNISMQVQVPARMDDVVIGGKHVVMDGAHNEQKMQAFVTSFMQMYPEKKVPVLLSLKQGKELAAVLPLLKPIISALVVTEFTGGQDLPTKAIDADELAHAAKKFGISNIVVETDPVAALQKLMSHTSDTVVITGSFYVIAQLRNSVKELKHA